MAKLEEIVEAAKNKGVLSECYTNISGRFMDCPVDGYGHTYRNLSTYVTVKISNHRYATWEYPLGPEYGKNGGRHVKYIGYSNFSTYNANSGATQKTFRKEQKALRYLGL